MIKTINEFVTSLRNNPNVIALIVYGSRRIDDNSLGGDFDLFVFVNEEVTTEIESIHLYISDIPVDLNIRTKLDLRSNVPLTDIDFALFDGEIIYDKYNEMSALMEQAKLKWTYSSEELSSSQIDWERFSQQHVIDKIRYRLKEDVVFSRFLLNTNIYWLINNYFRIRGLKYKGEKQAIISIREKSPEIYEIIEKFYSTNCLETQFKLTKNLTELVLRPVKGSWRKDELIFLPRRKNYDILKEDKDRIKKDLLRWLPSVATLE
jgi:hypothetical protein